jgi:hypothetical protein
MTAPARASRPSHFRSSPACGRSLLAHRHASSKFYKIETISARNHVHYFRLESAEFLDAGLQGLIVVHRSTAGCG